jgi:hypothetical protein
LFPFAYLIPLDENLQRNSLEGAKMINHLLNNGIQVKKALHSFNAGGRDFPGQTYIVPMHQGLRGLINTMLWSGEDLSLTVKAMYDVSVYSFPQMAGFDVYPIWEEFTVNWEEVRTAPRLKGVFLGKNNGSLNTYALPADNNDAVKAANILLKEGYSVNRVKKSFLDLVPGTFLIRGNEALHYRLKELTENYYIQVRSLDATAGAGVFEGNTMPIRFKKTAVVGENFGVCQAMKEMGFDVCFVEYTQLNKGFDLAEHGFEALILAGTETGIWRDPFLDELGIGFGLHYALVERGRQQLIKFVQAGHDFIGIGYAGAKLNEEAGILDIGYSFTSDAATGFMPESINAKQSAENGLCIINANPEDPLTFSYGTKEKVYVFGPVWYYKIPREVKIAASFGEGNFYEKGFWLNPELAAGKPVIVSGTKGAQKIVLMGLDPAFRCYIPATYRLLANALYFLGS